MKLLAICTGRPEKLPNKSYKTGIFKTPVNAAVMVDQLGLVGDAVCNTKHHGGPDQAILIEGSLTREWWMAQLGRDLPHGAFGENFVIEGLDNRDVAVGDLFEVGEVLLEATSPRSPCNTLAARMGDPKILKTYFRAARPGIYCRVIRTGMVSPGEEVRHDRFGGDRVTLPELLASLSGRVSDQERARFLLAPIASRWRASLN